MDTEARSPSEIEKQSPPDLTEEAALLVETVRESMGDPAELSLRPCFESVRARSARYRATAGRRGGIQVAVAGLLLVLALSVGLFSRLRARSAALSYQVEGVSRLDEGYLRAPAGQRAVARFSDGSRVELSPGTQARIRSTDAHGAQVALEDGELLVAVVHRAAASWLVEAGPFRIHVRGTRFSVTWSGANGKLEVRLLSGSLAVGGPLSEEPIALRGGQRLTVVLGAKQVVLDEIDSEQRGGEADRGESSSESFNGGEPAVNTVSGQDRAVNSANGQDRAVTSANGQNQAATPVDSSGASSATSTAALGQRAGEHRDSSGRDPAGPAAAPRGKAGGRSWASYLAEGNLQLILDEAQRRGLESTMDQCTSSDLSILADAARYKGHVDIAERALLKQRARFAGSVRSHDAAFLLGRLQETRGTGGLSNAVAWYDRYLNEVPGGTYAPEALGRKMTATERLYGPERARPIASTYLRDYPNGAYASGARALLQAR